MVMLCCTVEINKYLLTYLLLLLLLKVGTKSARNGPCSFARVDSRAEVSPSDGRPSRHVSRPRLRRPASSRRRTRLHRRLQRGVPPGGGALAGLHGRALLESAGGTTPLRRYGEDSSLVFRPIFRPIFRRFSDVFTIGCNIIATVSI